MKRTVGSLTFDELLTEMRPINEFFVSRYRQAMRTGANFPPPIVEKGTLRIVSGNHRVSAYLEEYGEDHEIEVIERKFKSEAEVLRVFAEENSRHGNPLSGYTQKFIAQRLLSLGDTPEEIAAALNIPVQKVATLGGMNVVVVGSGKRQMKPIKHGLEHKAGATVQAKAYEAHQKQDRGISARSIARQLVRWIDNGWIDMDDASTLDAMEELRQALGRLQDARAA